MKTLAAIALTLCSCLDPVERPPTAASPPADVATPAPTDSRRADPRAATEVRLPCEVCEAVSCTGEDNAVQCECDDSALPCQL